MPSDANLKRCPFCGSWDIGGPIEIIKWGERMWRGCFCRTPGCPARSGFEEIHDIKADAIARWNRRAGEDGGAE